MDYGHGSHLGRGFQEPIPPEDHALQSVSSGQRYNHDDSTSIHGFQERIYPNNSLSYMTQPPTSSIYRAYSSLYTAQGHGFSSPWDPGSVHNHRDMYIMGSSQRIGLSSPGGFLRPVGQDGDIYDGDPNTRFTDSRSHTQRRHTESVPLVSDFLQGPSLAGSRAGLSQRLPSEGPDFSINLEATEDIEKELEAFILYKNTGQYEKAHEMFEEVLAVHLEVFPVVAEYADLLLSQGLYRTLLDFLDIQLDYMSEVFTETEIELLHLIRSLAGIYNKGALRSALSRAVQSWQFLSRGAKDVPTGTLPNDTEIHIYEIYIKIVTFALATSNWATMDDMKCPWIPPNTDNCTGVIEWYKLLSQRDRLWEASRVLCSLLTIIQHLPPHEVPNLFDDHCFGKLNFERHPGNMRSPDALVAMSVSMDRAHALLNLSIQVPPSKKDQTSRRLWDAANRYRNAAVTLGNHNLGIVEFKCLRYQTKIQGTEFECASRILGFLMQYPYTARPSFDANGFTSAIPRDYRKCYIYCLAQEDGISHIFSYLSQLDDVGDLLGVIEVYELIHSLFLFHTGSETGTAMPGVFFESRDSHLVLSRFRQMTLDESTKQELMGIASRISRFNTFDGLIFEEANEIAYRGTEKSYPDKFDIPFHLLTLYTLENGEPNVSFQAFRGRLKNLDAVKIHMPVVLDIAERARLLVLIGYLPLPPLISYDRVPRSYQRSTAPPVHQTYMPRGGVGDGGIPVHCHKSTRQSSHFSSQTHKRAAAEASNIEGPPTGPQSLAEKELPVAPPPGIPSQLITAADTSGFDLRYRRQQNARAFFKQGRVFSVLWHEDPGITSRQTNATISFETGYGEQVFRYIRRLVVIKAYDRCAWCCPIYTYGNRGLSKNATDASKHAIVYTGTPPAPGMSEPRMLSTPLEVVPAKPQHKLSPMSRLNFGKIFTVEYNVKVLHIGKIAERSMPVFVDYARRELTI